MDNAGVLTRLSRHIPVLLQSQQAGWTYHEPGALRRADCHVVCHTWRVPDGPLQKVPTILQALVRLVAVVECGNWKWYNVCWPGLASLFHVQQDVLHARSGVNCYRKSCYYKACIV